jgi:predicted unusual protein kinase regulating ubiquinone biosynthesis (AarF/ABC1/UbiB family)
MEFVPGTKITGLSPVVLTEVDGRGLAEEVFRAWLKQILVDGMFHADPHPGNVLLTPDGRIALIDLGMVAWLSPTWRDGLFRLLLSLAEGRSDEVADVCVELSDANEDFDERIFRKKVAQIVARQQNASAEEVEVGRLVVEISQAATASGIRVPSELTMLGKTLLNLDGIGRTLAPGFQPNQAIREHGRELMMQRVAQQASSAHVFQKALEVNDLVQRMPTRLNRLLESLSHNRLKVKVDVIDENVIIDGMQKVANRITTGLILAALIIGSTMMMKIDTSFRIFGYPGFAILFFLAAAFGGLGLVVNVAWKDRLAARSRQ